MLLWCWGVDVLSNFFFHSGNVYNTFGPHSACSYEQKQLQEGGISWAPDVRELGWPRWVEKAPQHSQGSGGGRRGVFGARQVTRPNSDVLRQLVRSQAPKVPCPSGTAPPPGHQGEAHESVCGGNISYSNYNKYIFIFCLPVNHKSHFLFLKYMISFRLH